MIRLPRHLTTFLLAAMLGVLGACADMTPASEPEVPLVPEVDPQQRYLQGIGQYRGGQFDSARTNLEAALASGKLNPADQLDARKHMAFIHCAANREAACREQFQLALDASADFDLAQNEVGHPIWGPIWLSLKNAQQDRLAIKSAESATATPAQRELGEGIKDYDAGRFKEAITALRAALKHGLPSRADQIRAHKYSAFAYCLQKRNKECAAEFRAIFALDPTFALLPSEIGHPSWSSVYGRELAAAKRGQKK